MLHRAEARQSWASWASCCAEAKWSRADRLGGRQLWAITSGNDSVDADVDVGHVVHFPLLSGPKVVE